MNLFKDIRAVSTGDVELSLGQQSAFTGNVRDILLRKL